ncbi:MAG TPA: hypothetical protein VME18_10155 [Acidobacteriaceae bacterium]|nr:hypothetical protein [Acidobacteriaceae bacterium]
MKKGILLSAFLLAAIPTTHAQGTGGQPAGCHIGNLGEQPAAAQKAMSSFLRGLQSQVAQGHKSQVADMIAYPLHAWISGKNQNVQSKREFLQLYDQIFTKPLTKLLPEQRPACISRVGAQGFSISRGEIWFDIHSDGSVKIFNVTPVVMSDEYRP